MGGDEVSNMAVDQVLDLNVSWRDKVLGIGSGYSEKELGVMGSEDKDLDFLEGDVMKSAVNGILSINFSNRIKQILVKEMELTLVIRLLGRNIGYVVLYNRISILWKPSKPFHTMDIGNDYFFVKFQSRENSRLSLEQNRERKFKDKEGANVLINRRTGKEVGFGLDGPMIESNMTRSGSNALDREKSNKWVGEKPVIPAGLNE
ncbi:hypothetical protein Golax_024748 [Gossypium laxum]|uniref:DUF4283 domain-containing protein n=1 Tax=Gossypium laxum TaxID=34288 RepID=A0A7J8ZD10_9ROSI|nr:hypothetical protein [Gossypium laxum]